MDVPEGLTEAISKSLGRHLPKLGGSLLIIEPKIDSAGEASLRIRLVLNRRPADRAVFREQLLRVVDDTRSWLSDNEDPRFPYFEVTTQDEEDELETERRRDR